MSALLEVNNLWKKYSRDLKASVRYATRDMLLGRKNISQSDELRLAEFWALRDVSFSLRRGEVLGILGHNGAGKSTLLKCIAGKLATDRGTIKRNGEMGFLLEMSAGFAPAMTGRDNVSVRGRLMGKSGKDLIHYIDSVKDFAELGEFFDAPVQFYSSGMKSRLGFAASSSMQPDILIIDEVLAVGDLAFRLRCYERINEMARNAAVIFVSHSLGQIARLCNRGLYLEKGRALLEGDVQDAIALYQHKVGEGASRKRSQSYYPELISVSLVGDYETSAEPLLPYGTPLHLALDLTRLPLDIQLRIMLRDASQTVIMDWNSARNVSHWPVDPKRVVAGLGPMELAPGAYSLCVQAMSGDGVDHLCISEAIEFRISGKFLNTLAVQKRATWDFQ